MLDTIKIKGGQYLEGAIKIPPSKSLSHRALIASGLSKGGHVANIIDSEDIIATKACFTSNGCFVCQSRRWLPSSRSANANKIK